MRQGWGSPTKHRRNSRGGRHGGTGVGASRFCRYPGVGREALMKEEFACVCSRYGYVNLDHQNRDAPAGPSPIVVHGFDLLRRCRQTRDEAHRGEATGKKTLKTSPSVARFDARISRSAAARPSAWAGRANRFSIGKTALRMQRDRCGRGDGDSLTSRATPLLLQ